jgi:uncharacterized RDD family membrane protein YckC
MACRFMEAGAGGPVNPYAPPRAEEGAPVAAEAEGSLASRGARLGAAFIDAAFAGIAWLPVMFDGFRMGVFAEAAHGKPVPALWFLNSRPLALLSLALGAAVIALHAYLVTSRGQSVGKLLVGIRITRVDGRPVGFVDGVVVRSWVFGIISVIPRNLGAVAALIDVLFIFRRDRRCIHDLVAGTKVVEL